MEVLRSLNSVSNAIPHVTSKAGTAEQKFILHEIKYALLGAALMLIFLLPWSSSLIKSTFPGAKGPMVVIYKVILFMAIYYIIQKSAWFQVH